MWGSRAGVGLAVWAVLLGTLGGAGVRGTWLRAAFAEELSAAEKAWARQAADALASPSERQRASAAAALARLGPEAIPSVLTNLGKLKEDAHWDALESACVSMGAPAAASALEAARSAWPKAQATRLQTLLDRVRAARESAPPPAVGPAAPLPPAASGVVAELKRVLDEIEKSRRSIDPDHRLDDLRSRGRAVLPACLEELRMREQDGLGAKAAAQLARDVLAPGDVPLIRQLIEDGHDAAGSALTRQPAQVAVPILLIPLAKGFLSHRLFEALESFATDARVQAALLTWLEAQAAEGDVTFLVGAVAELLGEQRVKQAVPVLEKLVFDDAFANARRQVATALVDMGVLLGVQRLVDYFRAPPAQGVPEMTGLELGNWDRATAGERLNKIVGRVVFRRSGGAAAGFAAPEGNWEEASREFLAWFEQHKAKLRFDEKRQAWRTD